MRKIKLLLAVLLIAAVVVLASGCTESTTIDQETSVASSQNQATEAGNDVNETTESAEIEESIPAATTKPVEIKLSESCDKVLASGCDADGNYFELVANEEEDYNGTKIEMGIIKNNEWSIPLTLDSPFVGEDGLLGYGSGIYDEEIAVFYYIGAGCFYHDSCIWNGNNGKEYDYWKNDHYKPQVYAAGYEPFVNNDGIFLLNGLSGCYKLLDANTMTITETGLVEGFNEFVFPYSDGMFAVVGGSQADVNGFYDKTGKKVVDLSQYDLCKPYRYSDVKLDYVAEQNLVFENGKCTFEIWNDQLTMYRITIDKTGKVIASAKVH